MNDFYKNIDEYNSILEKRKILFDDTKLVCLESKTSTSCNRTIHKRLKIKHFRCFCYAIN